MPGPRKAPKAERDAQGYYMRTRRPGGSRKPPPEQKSAEIVAAARRAIAYAAGMHTAKLQLAKTFASVRELAARVQSSAGFQQYLRERIALLVPAGLVFLLISVACAAALVIFLAERHPLLALPGLVFAPVVLVGSFFVQAYVFTLWLEDRAIAHALGRRRAARWGIDMGRLPPVPWLLAGVLLFLPLVILFALATPAALVLVLLGAAAPVLYARLDR